jgi:transcriptional regulator NrdR family protein
MAKKTATPVESIKSGKQPQSFRDSVLAHLNKSDDQKQVELIDDKIEDFVIEIKSMITQLEVSEIPSKKTQDERKRRELKNATHKLEVAYLDFYSEITFEEYIEGINRRKKNIHQIECELASIRTEVNNLTEMVIEYKNLLAKFTA